MGDEISENTMSNFDHNPQMQNRGKSVMNVRVRPMKAIGGGMIGMRHSRMNSVSAREMNELRKQTKYSGKQDNWRASMLSKLKEEQIWLSPEQKPKTH